MHTSSLNPALGTPFTPPPIPDDPCCLDDEGMKVLISVVVGVALAILATVLAFSLTNIFVAIIVTGIAWAGAVGNGLASFICCCNTGIPPLNNQNRGINWINPGNQLPPFGGHQIHQSRGTGAPLLPIPQQTYQPGVGAFGTRAGVGSNTSYISSSVAYSRNSGTGAPLHGQQQYFPPIPFQGGINPGMTGDRAQVGRDRNRW